MNHKGADQPVHPWSNEYFRCLYTEKILVYKFKITTLLKGFMTKKTSLGLTWKESTKTVILALTRTIR